MDVFCHSNNEAYIFGMTVGLLCAENICYVVPTVVASKNYTTKNIIKHRLLGETADRLAICASADLHEIIIDPITVRVDDFSLQDAYRLGILASLRVLVLTGIT